MTKSEYKIMINENSKNFLSEIKRFIKFEIDISKYETIFTNENEKIDFEDLPFGISNYRINKKLSNNKKNEILNKILLKRNKKKFDYDLWRKKNKLLKIDSNQFMINLGYVSFVKERIYITDIEILERIKEYTGNKFLEENLKNLHIKILKTNKKITYSSCLEFPFVGESIIVFDELLEYDEDFFHFIHELSHALYNKYKFTQNKIASIEEDEKMAYSIQTEIIIKIFPEYKSSYMQHIYNLYKISCLNYEFEKFLYSNMKYDFEKRSQFFGKLLNKYGFSDVYYNNWIEDENYWNNPFYNSSYLKSLENILNDNYTNDINKLVNKKIE